MNPIRFGTLYTLKVAPKTPEQREADIRKGIDPLAEFTCAMAQQKLRATLEWYGDDAICVYTNIGPGDHRKFENELAQVGTALKDFCEESKLPQIVYTRVERILNAAYMSMNMTGEIPKRIEFDFTSTPTEA